MLPSILKRFREERPRVHVHLSSGTSEDIIERLIAGETHVAICRLTQHPEVESLHLYNDDLALVVAPNHPFAAKGRVTIAEAGREPFLFFERSSQLPQPHLQHVPARRRRPGIGDGARLDGDDEAHGRSRASASRSCRSSRSSGKSKRATLKRVEIRDMEQPAQREVGVHVLRNYTPALPVRDFLRMLTTNTAS